MIPENQPGMTSRLEQLSDAELIEIRAKADRILGERETARKKQALADIRAQAKALGLKVQFTERKSQRPLRRKPKGPEDESA